MLSTKAVICLLLATVALADINKQFETLLHGKETLSQHQIDVLYEQFLEEYKDGNGFTPAGSAFKGTHTDRKQIFADRVRNIIAHNTNPQFNWKKGINSYSDMTDEEFNQYFNMIKSPQFCSATEHTPTDFPRNFELNEIPATWDWREHNGVTPVKN